MNLIQTILLWILLNILLLIAMQIALFAQTTPEMENASMTVKLISSEFWASIEWLFVIPAQRLGIIFLNPAQLALSSYVFQFLSQIWSNTFWLKIKTTIDDYIGMVLILFGMYASKYRLFG
jgi:uncharacterized protein (DUF486 family)